MANSTVMDILLRTHAKVGNRATFDGGYDNLNAVMHHILKGKDVRWSFMEANGTLATVDGYETGTVTFTNGSTALVGVGTTFTSAMAGRKIILAGSTVSYTVATFTDTTNLVLDRVYEGDTAAGASYLIYQDVYSLASDFGEMLVLRDASNNVVLPSFDTAQIEQYTSAALATGLPVRYAMFGEDASGYENLLFHPPPGDVISYQYRYYKEPTIMNSEDDTLDTPVKYDHVVIALMKAQFTQDVMDIGIAEKLLDNMIMDNVRDKRAYVQKVASIGSRYMGIGRKDPNAVLSRS